MKYIFVLLFVVILAYSAFADNDLARDMYGVPVQGFAPYSTITRTGFKATTTVPFNSGMIGYKYQCTGAGTLKLGTRAAQYPVTANTEYTVYKNSKITQMAISSATSNTCKFLVH